MAPRRSPRLLAKQQKLIDDTMCANAANQPIYQALLDEAAVSGIPDHRAITYRADAEEVRISKIGLYTAAKEYHNIKDWVSYFECGPLENICPDIAEYIYNYIKNNPM
jgi:hypothetical protein